ncbi:MAG: BolA family protein [Mariprofundaceae bacterium]|nr:BolA family protein [Mariprofundaceae bacterium]
MSVTDQMREKLQAAFQPEQLEIIDESEKHRGHAGYREGGESHFQVTITSAAFEGLTRLQRHRAVHTALGPDLIARIHALALTLDTPPG